MTTTEKPEPGAATADDDAPDERSGSGRARSRRKAVAAPAAARRTRTTVTLGPFLVALTEQDRRDRRPTVLVALAYIAPDDAARVAGAARAVQARLAAAVASVAVTDLRSVAEGLFAAFAEPLWPRPDGDPVEHGIRISQLAVSLLPRDLSSGQVRPVATVSVADPDLAAA